MQIREVEITHQLGLHARACARIVQLASRFRCRIALVCQRRRASARNIVEMMLLAGAFGSTVRVETDGPDESVAMAAIVGLLRDGLGAPA
jgi:phosphocarrier protein